MAGVNWGRGGAFATNQKGLIIRRVERETQIVIRETLWDRVLYKSHYPVQSGAPRGKRNIHFIATKLLLVRTSSRLLHYGQAMWEQC